MPSDPKRRSPPRDTLESLPQTVRDAFARVRAVLMDADGVLTDGGIHVLSDGSEFMSFDVKDGSGLWMLHRAGIKLGIVTGRTTGIPEHRARTLPLDAVRSGSRKKDEVVREILAEWDVSPEETVFIGDDVLDGPALRTVGVPVCVADAVADVIPLAIYVTRMPGGRGAVREVADLVLEAKGLRQPLLDRLFGTGEGDGE